MVPLLHESYARSMTSHGYGHGFYEPESAEDVRPGLCGYIDDSGRFQTIVDLADKTAVAENGYSAIVTPDRMLTTSRRWGPKESSSVKKRETRFEAGASGAIAGVPADASMLLTYSHSSDFGAVLLCPGDILNEGYRQKSPFRKWASENAKNILECCPDVKQHGLFVVTSTWLTTDVSTTAWRDPSKQINIGVKIGVPGIGKLGPSYEYYRAQSSGSWIDADKTRQNVVFFGGIFLKYRPLNLGTKEISQREWESRSSGLGSKVVIEEPGDSGAFLMVDLTEVGDDDVETEEEY